MDKQNNAAELKVCRYCNQFIMCEEDRAAEDDVV